MLNQYTKIIRKTTAKNEKLELEKDSLLAKYDIAKKASVELKKKIKLFHPNSRSSNPLKRSLEKNMINLRGYIMSSSLVIIC